MLTSGGQRAGRPVVRASRRRQPGSGGRRGGRQEDASRQRRGARELLVGADPAGRDRHGAGHARYASNLPCHACARCCSLALPLSRAHRTAPRTRGIAVTLWLGRWLQARRARTWTSGSRRVACTLGSRASRPMSTVHDATTARLPAQSMQQLYTIPAHDGTNHLGFTARPATCAGVSLLSHWAGQLAATRGASHLSSRPPASMRHDGGSTRSMQQRQSARAHAA